MIKPDKIADADEVLEYLTACIRAGSAGGMKAAELLAKRYGLLGERPAAAEVPRIIDDIMEGEEGVPDG